MTHIQGKGTTEITFERSQMSNLADKNLKAAIINMLKKVNVVMSKEGNIIFHHR